MDSSVLAASSSDHAESSAVPAQVSDDHAGVLTAGGHVEFARRRSHTRTQGRVLPRGHGHGYGVALARVDDTKCEVGQRGGGAAAEGVAVLHQGATATVVGDAVAIDHVARSDADRYAGVVEDLEPGVDRVRGVRIRIEDFVARDHVAAGLPRVRLAEDEDADLGRIANCVAGDRIAAASQVGRGSCRIVVAQLDATGAGQSCQVQLVVDDAHGDRVLVRGRGQSRVGENGNAANEVVAFNQRIGRTLEEEGVREGGDVVAEDEASVGAKEVEQVAIVGGIEVAALNDTVDVAAAADGVGASAATVEATVLDPAVGDRTHE